MNICFPVFFSFSFLLSSLIPFLALISASNSAFQAKKDSMVTFVPSSFFLFSSHFCIKLCFPGQKRFNGHFCPFQLFPFFFLIFFLLSSDCLFGLFFHFIISISEPLYG